MPESRHGRVVGFRLLTAGIGLLTSLILAEILLRILGLGYGNIPFDPDPVLHHVNPRNYQFVSYSPHGEYGGFTVNFDGQGERDLEWPRPSSPRYRFALLGDSFAAGLEVPAAQSLAGLLARKGADRTEVRNFGTTAYGPLLSELQWRVLVARTRPTHVLLLLYCNDPVDDVYYDQLAQRDQGGRVIAVPYTEGGKWQKIFRKSYLIRWVRKILATYERRHERGTEVGGFTEVNPDWSSLTKDSLKNLASEIKSTGARFIVSAVPSKATLFGKHPPETPVFSHQAEAWARQNGIEYLDLTKPFRDASRSEALYFPKDIHWNTAGNRIAAEAVQRHLPELFMPVNQTP